MPDENFLLVKEVAAYLRISKATVYRLIKNRELEARKIGRVLRVPKDSADQWLEETNTLRMREEETL